MSTTVTDTPNENAQERIRTLALLACPAGKLVIPATLGCSQTPAH